jgi:hypothetical protein
VEEHEEHYAEDTSNREKPCHGRQYAMTVSVFDLTHADSMTIDEVGSDAHQREHLERLRISKSPMAYVQTIGELPQF